MPQVVICNVPKLEPFYLSPTLAMLKGACNFAGINSLTIDFNVDFVNTCDQRNIDYHVHMVNVSKYAIANEELKKVSHELISNWALELISHQPELIAISVFSYFGQYFARELCVEIKRLNPAIKIILGGAGITDSITTGPRFAKELQQKSIVDYYIEGEAEIAWPMFLSKFFDLGIEENSISTDNFLNIAYLPDYSDFDINGYNKFRTTEGFLWLPVTGSRGCVRNCTFCEIPATWKFVQKNADNVRKEVASALAVADQLHIHFTDSLVNGSLSGFDKILDNLIELQSINTFQWGGQYIIRQGKVEDWGKIKKSGCRILEIGMETGSDSLRYEMDKRFKNEDLVHALEMMKQHNIKCVLLMFCGYPTETPEQFNETLEFFKLIQCYADSSVRAVQLNFSFCVYKDTPLYNSRRAIELKLTPDPAQWTCGTNPELTFMERTRRRLVTQEHLEDLGFKMASNTKEALLELVVNYMRYRKGQHYTFDQMALEVLGRPTTIKYRQQ
jgi:hypothetical protein